MHIVADAQGSEVLSGCSLNHETRFRISTSVHRAHEAVQLGRALEDDALAPSREQGEVARKLTRVAQALLGVTLEGAVG